MNSLLSLLAHRALHRAVICPGSALVVHAPLPRALGAGDAVVGGGDDDDGAVGAMTFILSTADPSSETLGAS